MEFILAAALASPADPPVCDRDRFPRREAAYQAMQFNRAYRHHIEARRWTYLHQREYWDQVLAETDYLFQCWDWLHAAQGGEGRDETYWRYSLKRLQSLLGDDIYLAGDMPPPVPVWRFRPID